MSLSKELPKCFVCFQPTEKFGETENTFLSVVTVVMFLRLKGLLPYPPEGSPVRIRDWEPCEPCVPKTLDLYKEYAKLEQKMKERRGRRQRVKEVRAENANIGKEKPSKDLIPDDSRNGKEKAANNSEESSGMRLRKRPENKGYAHFFLAPEEEKSVSQKKNKGPKPFKCPRCPSSFVDKSTMTRHVKFVHDKVRPFKCPKCPLKFPSKFQLRSHTIRVHESNGSSRFKCHKCQASFKRANAFSRHIHAAHSNSNKGTKDPLIHRGEEEATPQQKVIRKGPSSLDQAKKGPNTDRKKGRKKKRLQCPQCPISFSRADYLQSHIRVVHEGVRAFKCPRCPKSFTRRYLLRDHVAIVHEGRVLYKCPRPNCRSTFANKHCINLHVESVHEKRRDFKCPVCCKGFFRKADCAAHEGAVHKM